MSRRMRKAPAYQTSNEIQSELDRLREKEIRNGWLSKPDQRYVTQLIAEANRRNGSLQL